MIRYRDGYVFEDAVVMVLVIGEDVVAYGYMYVWTVVECTILRDEGEDKIRMKTKRKQEAKGSQE